MTDNSVANIFIEIPPTVLQALIPIIAHDYSTDQLRAWYALIRSAYRRPLSNGDQQIISKYQEERAYNLSTPLYGHDSGLMNFDAATHGLPNIPLMESMPASGLRFADQSWFTPSSSPSTTAAGPSSTTANKQDVGSTFTAPGRTKAHQFLMESQRMSQDHSKIRSSGTTNIPTSASLMYPKEAMFHQENLSMGSLPY